MSNVSVSLNTANVVIDQANSAITVNTTTSNVAVAQMSTVTVTGGGGQSDRLVAGAVEVVLNANATMTFPNNAIDFGNQSADLKSSSYSELWYHTANPEPTAGQGIQTYVWAWENQAGIAVESVDNGYKEWYFNANGTVTYPTLTTDHAGQGQTLKFSDPAKQVVITGPDATAGNPNSQRLVIQGTEGYVDGGEGGDIYLWAGNSGVGGGSGGDIKVDAGYGYAGSEGGTIKIRAGASGGGAGNGGFVDIHGGYGAGDGGPIRIYSGNGTEQLHIDNAGVGNISIADDKVIFASHGAYGVPDNSFANARIGLYGTNYDYAIGVEGNHVWLKGTTGVKLYSGDNVERLAVQTTGASVTGNLSVTGTFDCGTF